jgi:hypothetical protein
MGIGRFGIAVEVADGAVIRVSLRRLPSWETVVCQLAIVSPVRKTGYVLAPDDIAAQTPGR